MQEHPASDPLDVHAHAPGEGPDPSDLNPGVKAPAGEAQAPEGGQDAQKPLQAGSKGAAHLQRADAKGAPSRMRTKGSMSREELEEMGRQTAQQGGSGSYHGHGRPRSPEERLKAPYSGWRPSSYSGLADSLQSTSASASDGSPAREPGTLTDYRMRKGLRADEF